MDPSAGKIIKNFIKKKKILKKKNTTNNKRVRKKETITYSHFGTNDIDEATKDYYEIEDVPGVTKIVLKVKNEKEDRINECSFQCENRKVNKNIP